MLRQLIPSQNLLFELAQHTPENRQWAFTIPYQEFQVRLMRKSLKSNCLLLKGATN